MLLTCWGPPFELTLPLWVTPSPLPHTALTNWIRSSLLPSPAGGGGEKKDPMEETAAKPQNSLKVTLRTELPPDSKEEATGAERALAGPISRQASLKYWLHLQKTKAFITLKSHKYVKKCNVT